MQLNIEHLNLIFQQFLTVFPLILFLLLIYKWFHTKSPLKKPLPPCPPKLPILGNLHQLGTNPHSSLRSLSKKYGELMIINLGKAQVLIVSSSRAATEIMKTHDVIFSNRPISKTGYKLLYNGKDVAAAQYGEYWRQMKSICVLQLLSNKRVQSFRSVREEELILMMEKIEKSSSLVVNLSEMFMNLTNNVICRVAFGRTYDGKGGVDFKKILRNFTELLGRFKVGDFIPCLAWTKWLDGWDAKVDKVAKEFDEFLEQVLKEHENVRVESRKCGESEDDEIVKDFVDVLLDVQREKTTGLTIDRDSIKALILDMFSGGTDTTYTVIEWAMTELFIHPIAMKRLQKEVRETGQKTYINEDDLEKMKYLKAVIKETLRLHPPIPLLVPRQSTQETKINGYDIPSGTTVIINAWAIHRDHTFWHEPENFNPERFVSSPNDFRGQSFELIPFGGGRRICPGIQFAMAINELVLANLVYKFDWALPGGTEIETLDMSESVGVTKHRKTPLLAVATPAILK